MPKNKEKVIEDEGFTKKAELSNDVIKKLIVPSYNEAAKTIIKNWKNGPILMVGAKLALDNKTLENIEPVLLGTLFRKTARKWVTTKFWNFKESCQLKLQPIDLSLFRFGEGLRSNLVDSKELAYSFVDSDGKEIPATTLADQGFNGFSIRLYLAPSSAYATKLKLVMYPASKDTLDNDHQYSQDGRFPGLLITSTEIDMGIAYSQVTDKSFGTTICPVLISQQQYDDTCEVPTAEHVVACISKLLRTAMTPETAPDHKALWERWGEIKREGVAKLRSMEREHVWPLFEDDTDQGKNLISKYFIKLLVNFRKIIDKYQSQNTQNKQTDKN